MFPMQTNSTLMLMPGLPQAQWLPEQTAQFTNERIAGSITVGDCAADTPDRAGPRIIRVESGDVVNVQLRHLITERGNVEFVGGEVRFHRLAQPHRLLPQLRLIGLAELKRFGDVAAPGHQNQPGVARVVHQQHLAEWRLPH